MSEVIKVYDSKGHTVLKKSILEHLNAKAGSYLMVIPTPGKREVRLLPYDEEAIWKSYFPKIGGGIEEREELERKDITHFEASKEIE